MDELMVELGIRPKHMAEYFKVHRNTVTRWHKHCPKHVIRHLELLVSFKHMSEAIRDA